MLDSSTTIAKRLLSPGRAVLFAFAFLSFVVLVSIFSIPLRNHSIIQHNQSKASTVLSHSFSNSTITASQSSQKSDGLSGETRTNSSEDDQISKRTNGFSRKVSPSNGLSMNHNFSSGTGTSSSDYLQVYKNTNGYSRKVKSPHRSNKNIHDGETSDFSRNVVREKEAHKGLKRKTKKKGNKNPMKKINHCRFFEGRWIRDDRHPLYKPGSCPFIDESFDCFGNGKPENAYERYRWQPEDCELPRWNGKKLLRLLRGKRLAYVGDSLNRNMWESMVCMLRNSAHNKSNVYEASHREEFRTEGSYSFIFKDYNFSVEFFRSPFLVQEWEMPDTNGSKKETLRLDLVEKSCDKYKGADILVFNTGHWWTHEKTSAGKGYYQEGDYIYDELHVMEAFRKAMTTWANWIDSNINPMKTLVFFRGYSSSHFSGGQWNSGGQCEETDPIENEKDLPHDNNRPIMEAAEKILMTAKTPVFYLNITRMSEFRKDAHPSIYRKPNMTKVERTQAQDCSHWCLPGVPDTWNEIVYSQLLLKFDRNLQRKLRELQQIEV